MFQEAQIFAGIYIDESLRIVVKADFHHVQRGMPKSDLSVAVPQKILQIWNSKKVQELISDCENFANTITTSFNLPAKHSYLLPNLYLYYG